jgi:hypothetical protein
LLLLQFELLLALLLGLLLLLQFELLLALLLGLLLLLQFELLLALLLGLLLLQSELLLALRLGLLLLQSELLLALRLGLLLLLQSELLLALRLGLLRLDLLLALCLELLLELQLSLCIIAVARIFCQADSGTVRFVDFRNIGIDGFARGRRASRKRRRETHRRNGNDCRQNCGGRSSHYAYVRPPIGELLVRSTRRFAGENAYEPESGAHLRFRPTGTRSGRSVANRLLPCDRRHGRLQYSATAEHGLK